MAKIKTCNVRFSDHAAQRLKERGRMSKKLTPKTVRQILLGMLPMGLQVHNQAVEVPVHKKLYAVCVPELAGGWTVLTFKIGPVHNHKHNRKAKQGGRWSVNL